MGSVASNHRPARGIVLLLAASKSKAVVPELLELGLQLLFAPATVALVAANVLIFFRPGPLDGILPAEDEVAFNALQQAGPKALLSSFYHGNLDHLFNNMACLVETGAALESSMGTAGYASMVAALVGLSHAITVVVCKGMVSLGDDAKRYDYNSIGFSGILFGMETVLACSRSFAAFDRCVFSMRFTAEYAGLLLKSARVLWKLGMCADLFIAQALVPEADFLGHLAGLLAGFLYHLLKRSLKGADPLAWLISRGVRSVALAATCAQEHLMSSVILLPDLPNIIKYCCTSVTANAAAGSCRSRGAGGDDGGRRRREYPRGIWTCSTCNYYNSAVTDTCEMCSTMREDCAFSRRRQLASSSRLAPPFTTARYIVSAF